MVKLDEKLGDFCFKLGGHICKLRHHHTYVEVDLLIGKFSRWEDIKNKLIELRHGTEVCTNFNETTYLTRLGFGKLTPDAVGVSLKSSLYGAESRQPGDETSM